VHLIEILLPLTDNAGKRIEADRFAHVTEELVASFGGLTAFTRSPAEGIWDEGGERTRDDIVILEVLADELDRHWWRDYRQTLERMFRQDEVIIRAARIERL
jgi:hypothetical protein